MLDFSDLVFFGYLLAGLTGLFYFGRWLIRFLSTTSMTPDMRVLFTVSILAVVIFAGFSQSVRLSDWRTAYKEPDTNPINHETRVEPPPTTTPAETSSAPANPEQDMLDLIQGRYPELTKQRTELAQRIDELQQFFTDANALGKQAPEQKYLLQGLIDNRWKDYQSRTRTAHNVHNALRGFWVHYNTGSSTHALQRFDKAVPDLIDDIEATQSNAINYRNTEAGIIRKHGQSAIQTLRDNKLPRNWSTALTDHMYVGNNRQRIITWMQTHNYQTALTNLTLLSENYQDIVERINKVRAFRDTYQDLSTPLEDSLRLWQEALGHNILAQYRILFIADSEYVLEALNITSNAVMRQQLRNALKNKTDQAVTLAERAKRRAEQSYNPATFKGNTY